MKVFKKVAVIALVASIAPTALAAEELSFEKQATAEDIKNYESAAEEAKLVTGFVQAAFSDVMWNEDVGQDYYFGANQRALDAISEKSISYYEANYPWYVPYIMNSDELPHSGVVHRWEQDINFAVGWPQITGSVSTGASADFENLVSRQLGEIIPQISEATGLKVSYIEPDSAIDKSEQYARIRIIPVKSFGIKNYFKEKRNTDIAGTPNPENYLIYSKRFTPYSRSQLAGFLVPNSDNSIGLAICKVNSELPEGLMKALITECAIRSLGFPSLSNVEDETALSNWNSANDAYSKRPAYDGKEALYVRFDNSGKFKLPPVTELKSETHGVENGLSKYDMKLLSALYCPELRSGMNKFEATKVLLRNPKCIKTKGEQNGSYPRQ